MPHCCCWPLGPRWRRRKPKRPQRSSDDRCPRVSEDFGANTTGKPLLVNFWATWCEPCRDEYPMLNELAKQYAPKGLQVVGVSMDDDGDLILMRRFLARYKPIFPNYRKTAGAEAAFRQSVLPGWTGSMPVSVFYAKDGRQVAHFIGEKSREQYEEAIRALLADGGSRGVAGKVATSVSKSEEIQGEQGCSTRRAIESHILVTARFR